MRQITLERVELENFRSFAGKQTVELTTEPGLKHLTGDNQVEPRLGANGAGKSTFLDAIFWCWYGVSVKGQRAAELASWGEGKVRPAVSTALSIDGESYTISRQGMPDRLYINGEPASQDQVDAVLGLSKARAMQALVFGQNAPFFIDLSLPQRGALLDEVMDLEVWLVAAEVARLQEYEHTEDASRLALTIAGVEGALGGLADEADLRARAAEWQAKRRATLAKAQDTAEEEDRKYDALEAEYQRKLKIAGGNGAELRETQAEALEARTLFAKATRTVERLVDAVRADRKKLKHWQEEPDCPTCGQRWPEGRRKKQFAAVEQSIADTEQELKAARAALATAELRLEDAEQAHEAALRKDGGKGAEATAALKAMKEQARVVMRAAENAEHVAKQVNPYSGMADRIAEQRADLEKRKAKLGRERLAALGNAEEARFWYDAFKRVRLFEVRRVLDHLTLEVERAAGLLGLAGWRIEFTTATETKSGSVKQGVQVLVHSPLGSAPWDSWSGGEGQRVRLAVAIGFATMVQRMSGVRYTFEFWDEPSAWLSEQGIEDLVATLADRSQSENLSLWLVDHRALHAGAFSEVWVATKTAAGSTLARK